MSILILFLCLYLLWFIFYYDVFSNTGIEMSLKKKVIYKFATDLKPLLYIGLLFGCFGVIFSSIMLCRSSILKEQIAAYDEINQGVKEQIKYDLDYGEIKVMKNFIAHDKLWYFIL